MRTTALTAITAAALALTAVPASATGIPPINDTALKAAIAGLPQPAATGALVRISGSGGQWSGTAGVHDIVTGAAVRPAGTFRIGSVTKVFTAVLIFQLVQEHRVQLDEPVQRYLPGVLPADYPPIPVKALLNHTAGLPTVHVPGEENPQWILDHRYDDWTPAQVLAIATQHPIEFAPGTMQSYNNTNYIVLGMLAENLTHQSYSHLLRSRITGPLGLCQTYYPDSDPRLTNASARGYIAVGDQLEDATEMNQSIPWAAGGMISTAADLDTFITALFRGRLLGPAMMGRMFTVPDVQSADGSPARFSEGLTTVTVNGVTLWGKTGSRYGYTDGVFATRDLARKIVYSINETSKTAEGQSGLVQKIAYAATS